MKHKTWSRVLSLGVVTAVCFAAGCGKGYVPVAGKVYLDDKPLPEANVSFTPVPKGLSGDSLTDQDGGFILTTHKYGDGLKPGTYKVTVTKMLIPEGMKDPEPPKDAGGTPIMMSGMDLITQRKLKARGEWGIPQAYWSAETTPITIEIPSGGDKNVEVRVSSKTAN